MMMKRWANLSAMSSLVFKYGTSIRTSILNIESKNTEAVSICLKCLKRPKPSDE